MLTGRQAYERGFVDALFEPVEFLDEFLALLLEKIEEGAGKVRVRKPISPTSPR